MKTKDEKNLSETDVKIFLFSKVFLDYCFGKKKFFGIDRVWGFFRRLSGRSMTGGQKRLGHKKKSSKSENKAKKRAASLAAVDSARHDPIESRRVVTEGLVDAAVLSPSTSSDLDLVSPTPSDQLVIDEERMTG